jgi:hypothetical protein
MSGAAASLLPIPVSRLPGTFASFFSGKASERTMHVNG